MNRITFPLTPEMRGEGVADLQDGLRLLLERGFFRLSDSERQEFKAGLGDERAENIYLQATRRLVALFQEQRRVEPSGEVDERTARALNAVLEELGALDEPQTFVVRGHVGFANGLPAVGYVVTALDRDLRSEEWLGDAPTNHEGFYEVRYSPDQFRRAEKGHADLQVRISRDREGETLRESDVHFNAPEMVTIDLQLDLGEPRLSEYERLLGEIEPLLGGVVLADLTPEDAEFLAGDTGIDAAWISYLSESEKAEGEATERLFDGDRAGRERSIPAAAFYGWFRVGVPSEVDLLLQTPPDALSESLRLAIRDNIVPAGLGERLDLIRSLLSRLRAGAALAVPAQGTGPTLGDLLGLLRDDQALDSEQAANFAELQSGPVTGPELWNRAAEILPEPQLHGVQGLYVLNRIAGGEEPVLQAAAIRLRGATGGDGSSILPAIAAMDVGDWREVLRATDQPDIDEDSLARRGRELTRRVAELMPTDFLLERAKRMPDTDRLQDRIGSLAQLQERSSRRQEGNGRRIFDRAFEELETGDIGDDDRAELGEAFSEVQRLVRFYPGLELGQVLDGDETPDGKAAEISRRVGLVDRVYRQNPEVDFLRLDYAPDGDSADLIEFDGLEDDEQAMVLRTLKAYMRVYQAAGNALAAKEVLEAGFSSAVGIADVELTEFARATGLSLAEAQPIHAAAKDRALDAGLQFVAVRDYVEGVSIAGTDSSDGSAPENKTIAYLRKLDGFEQMFGRQSVCRCRHCRSVLSPAAYFVDLMHFIDRNVSDPVFGGRPGHPLRLQARRPDLWDLELTCDNTERLIPTLQIVNEILERQIRGDAKQVYETLAMADDSVRQPLVLPLRRIELYLGHFERTRADVARALGVDGDTYARSRLGLSVLDYDLIVAGRSVQAAFFERLFGEEVGQALTASKKIDVQSFLRSTGWTRDEFGQLIDARFVRGQASISIKAEKSDASSVQNDVEVVSGVHYAVLDRLHRFDRLWRKLPWQISELDQALYHLGNGTPQHITGVHLQDIAFLLDVQKRFGTSLEESAVLCADFPPQPFSGRRPLYDRLFNPEPFVTQDGAWSADPAANEPSVAFIHPAFGGGASQPDNQTLQRLIAGLQVTDQELVELLLGLGLAPSGGGSVSLTPANLALLYRHARLARQLKLSVEHLLQILTLGRIGTAPHAVRNPDDLAALLAFYDRWQESGRSLDELGYITGGPVLKADTFPDATALTDAIARTAWSDRPMEFDDTVLTQLSSVTEAKSRDFVAANAGANGALEKVTDSRRWRLKGTFDVDRGTLTLPEVTDKEAAAGVTPEDELGASLEKVRALLRRYDPREFLPGRIAAQLRLPETKVAALDSLAGGLLSEHNQALRHELEPERESDEPDVAELPKLVTILRRLLPLTVLLSSDAWDDAALKFLSDRPGLFGLSPTPPAPLQIPVETAFKASAYARLSTTREPEFSPDQPGANPAAVRELLEKGATVDPAEPSAARKSRRETIARALRVSPSRIEALHPHLVLTGDPFAALERVAACLELAGYLGVSGETLRLLVPQVQGGVTLQDDAKQEYDALADAAEGMYGVIRAKYPDERTFEEKIEAIEDQIRGLKRDGLVEYLIRSTDRGFTVPNDLYQMYLIDTQVEGCARTSRLVSAISSLQLYVHRILMNLEGEDPVSGGSAPVHVEPWRIPSQWAWRKNYRVWEANRKVFLHPESYLEPSLRDDKTPLFEELESTLLQQEINEQSATDAYASYLRGFVEVAGLKIAGAYNERTESMDRLHLIGVTPTDPPTFYYRRVENLYLSQRVEPDRARMMVTPWRKLKVPIPVPTVSLIPYRGSMLLFWVETSTTPKTSFVDGTSKTTGYTHMISLKVARMLADGTWTAPQLIRYLGDDRSKPADTFSRDDPTQTLSGFDHEGFTFERMYPYYADDGSGRLVVRLSGPVGVPATELSMHNSRLGQSTVDRDREVGRLPDQVWGLRLQENNLYWAAGHFEAGTGSYHQLAQLLQAAGAYVGDQLVAWARPPNVQPVNGADRDYVVEVQGVSYLLQEHAELGLYRLHRLQTTVAERLSAMLASFGVAGILATAFQESLAEDAPPLSAQGISLIDATDTKVLQLSDNSVIQRPIDFASLNGVYFRELFFQIPFLIADHLNSQQRFSAAQRWYHYIFDPTSPETGPDRVWRYREFRGLKALDPKAVREYLSDSYALAAYREDPFNPHAIARLRLSAYQKAVVMKYIDNLLDWGDSLFAEFTMESVNEATMLYVMATDVLGPRPADVGDCGEGDESSITYASVAPALKADSQFLIELEHLAPKKSRQAVASKQDAIRFAMSDAGNRFTSVMSTRSRVPTAAGTSATAIDGADVPTAGGPAENALGQPFEWRKASRSYWTQTGGTDLRGLESYGGIEMNAAPSPAPNGAGGNPLGDRITIEPGSGPGGNGVLLPRTVKAEDYKPPDTVYGPHGAEQAAVESLELPPGSSLIGKWPAFEQLEPLEIFKKSLVFCFPPNKDLLAYWDRVESRLYRIRNCMDISGARRPLALFAPEIDPRLLVRARAAGLSLEEALGVTSGSVPPYRFAFLIEKAKQYAGTVQSLGSALLSALEKRDAEDLNRLRAIHEQNILKLRTQAQTWEIEAADDNLASLNRQKEVVEFRRDHFKGLVEGELTPWERTQQTARHTVTTLHGIEASTQLLRAVASLIPQIGAPTAMKYGGMELKGAAAGFAHASQALAQAAEAVSASAGLEATFQRREEEWTHQEKLADKELLGLEKQIEAADIRKKIAEHSLELHNKSIEQAEELFALYRDKFSSFGLYTWLSTQVHRLYRDAYNMAFSVARMAERAYRFERDDDTATFLSSSHWDTARSGLLAGERLLLDLQQLERRFMETNLRSMEIEQSFSLMQFAPDELLKLRQTGECEFGIPEVLFDLAYPGHYRRRIKAVRLTIPCVTGPYVNVAATLRLTNSELRREPKISADLEPIPPRHTTVVATSTAQNDAGVLEFGFRDERYMPFEGAGAVSSWRLTLPKNFRSFDYGTISDVILRISYTAEESEALRTEVEEFTGGVEGTVRHYLANTGLPLPISMRRELPDVWHRLTRSPAGTPESFELTERHLPFLFASLARRSVELKASDVEVILQIARTPELDVLTPNLELEFDDMLLSKPPGNTPLSGNHWREKSTGLHSAMASQVKVLDQHTVKIKSSGNLGSTDGSAPGVIDTAKLIDIVLNVMLKT